MDEKSAKEQMGKCRWVKLSLASPNVGNWKRHKTWNAPPRRSSSCLPGNTFSRSASTMGLLQRYYDRLGLKDVRRKMLAYPVKKSVSWHFVCLVQYSNPTLLQEYTSPWLPKYAVFTTNAFIYYYNFRCALDIYCFSNWISVLFSFCAAAKMQDCLCTLALFCVMDWPA